ncbi:MAG: hypothetical protein KatS3mg105_3622 [Gemmatales bacterium]|nr:MAG: hypothetical protein KatS3mg105_3622 [Gemmatales bacterium]
MSATFWRQIDWRLWRQSYLAHTPDTERLAWIRPYRPNADTTTGVPARSVAFVRDISLGGITLESSHEFPSGMLLHVDVQSFARPVPVTLLARVIFVSKHRGPNWLLSCCFARELSDDDLRDYGAGRIASEANDGRVWVRFPVQAEASFHSVMSEQHNKWKARIANISAGGIGLFVDRSFEVGSLLNLELLGSKSGIARQVKARVVHCRQQNDGQFLLGCTYVGELSDEELQSLLPGNTDEKADEE